MIKDLFNQQLTLNWITRILFFVSLSAFLPAMPHYIREIGGNYSETGIVMSAFALGVLLFRPLVGKKIDTVGRKVVLLFGTLIFVAAPIIYMFVKSIHLIIAARVFHGLGLAAFGTASITLITDAAPEEKRGEVLSYTGMVNTIAFAIGPVLGFYAYEKWGSDILFLFLSGLAFLSLITSSFLHETRTHSSVGNNISYLNAIRQRPIIVASVIILLVGIIHGGVMFYIPFYLEGFHVNVGLFFAVYGVAAFVIRLIVGSASDRIGRGPFVAFALILLTLAVFVLSKTDGIVLMFISAILYGFGFGAQQPALTALVADNTTDETRGKIFSFYYGGFDLGISITGLSLGFVAEKFGLRTMFVICGFITSAALVVFGLSIEKGLLNSLRCTFAIPRTPHPHRDLDFTPLREK